ncbi:MAG TPA: VWA domain-containing protein [Candidatus Sulfotelmatobacter sp.]
MFSAQPFSVRPGWRPGLLIIGTLYLVSAAAFAQAQGTQNTPAPGEQQPAAAPPSQDGAIPAPQGDQPTAQAPDSTDQGMFVFKKQVEEVVLHATVLDQQRKLVPNLDKGAFTVFQDGTVRPITSFRREDVPVAMGIVIDNSGSMRDKREKVNQAVMNLIRVSNPEDEIFVVNFSEQYYLDQDFTSDPQLLQTALHQTSMKGSTALYDAIVASAVHLANNHRLEKKVLLVITDGQDNMSQETLEEATRKLEQVHGPTLYSIGLLGSGLQNTGYQALQSLANGTGGVAYFPDTLDQVNDITRTIAKDIRSQYILAYRPANQKSQPAYQSLKVEAHAPGYGQLTVRTRTGVYQNESPR